MIATVTDIHKLIDQRRELYRHPGSSDDWAIRDFEERYFLYVDSIENVYSVDIVRALISSYEDSFEDFGTQEAISAKISEADSKVFAVALEAEIHRLMLVAPVWLEDLLTQRALFDAGFIGLIGDEATRDIVKGIIARSENLG